MKKYIPSMYKKSIFDFNYDKLKSIGIKSLIFDLDYTIALIVIISNNTKNRISMFWDPIDITFVSFALKP